MKRATEEKTRKQRASAALTPPCGTLSYLAECRGAPQKAETFRRQGPTFDFMNRTVRRFPADR